jgi:NADH-quinone oxidoreductase subunit M
VNQELHFPWLEIAILIPLLGAIGCFLFRNQKQAYPLACIASGLTFLCSVGEWIDFETLGSFSAHDHWDVFFNLFSKQVLVIDELSAPLLPLTALLYFLAILSTPNSKAIRFPFLLTLVSESLTVATLCCTNPGLLVAILGLSIVPVWFELRDRNQCTRLFVIHMVIYVSCLLAGIAIFSWVLPSQSFMLLASILLMTGSLVRAGVLPVHIWQVDLFERASLGSALLFITPMTGAYAVMRLVLPIAPTWAMQSIAILSLATAVYAAGMSLVQKEMRRFFCFLCLSQSSLVLAGLEISNTIGMTGALCVWLSACVSLGGFGLIVRVVEARIGRISLDRFHGLFEQLPLLAALFLLTGLSSIGFPGTLGFVGMELLVEGTAEFYPLVGGLVVFTGALNGIAILRAYFYVFTGTRHMATISLSPRRRERIAAIVLSLIVIGGGLWPQPMVHSRYHAANALLRLRQSQRNETSDLQSYTDMSDSIATQAVIDVATLPTVEPSN